MNTKLLTVCALAVLFSCSTKADVLPSAVDGIISIEGEVLVEDSVGANSLAAASQIVLNEGSRLVYKSSEALVLSAKVSGSGSFVFDSAAAESAVTLSGDNSGLVAPGCFEIKNTKLIVTSETGLGSGASGAATFIGNMPDGMLRFVGESNVFTNYAPIVMKLEHALNDGVFFIGSESADNSFVQAASLSVSTDNFKITHLYFKHNFEMLSGVFTVLRYPYFYQSGAGTVKIGEDVDVVWGDASQAIVYFNNLILACRNFIAPQGLAPSGANNVVFEVEDCLGEDTPLRPYVTWHEQTTWHYNLNGFNQTVSHLWAIENEDTGGQCALVGSATPATLTAAGSVTGMQSARWKFFGPLSYVHDTSFTNIFTTYKLAATGALTVSNGKVAFTNGSGWAGEEVTVKAGGVLFCASVASLDSGEHVLKVESGGELEVAAGVTLKVRSAVIGSVTLPAGRLLSMNEVRSLTEGEGVTLTGEGNIQTAAGSVSGTWTGWPEVGSVEEVVIPDGSEVVITADDIEKVQALSAIKAGVRTRITCRDLSREFELSCAISGSIVFDASDCEKIILNSDNSGIINPGGFIFSNTTVVVSNRFGLGGALTGAAHFYPAAPLTENRSMLTFGGDAVSNDVKLIFHHGAYFGYEDPSVRFVQNADLTQLDGSSTPEVQRAYMIGDFTIAAPHTMNVYATHLGVDNVLRIEEGATLKANGNFGNGYYYIAGNITGDLAIEQGMRKFVFERENALNVNSCRFYDGSEKKFFFDLNGFNQVMPRVLGNQYGTTQYQQCFDVTSATPATLTLNAGANMSSGAAIRCLDQASLTYSGASTQTIGFATSTTVGALTINSGAVAMERNAKWLGTNVVVNGGLLIIRPSAATNTFGVGRATVSDLFVNGEGKIELQSDSYISTVRSITLDGKLLESGIYNAANCSFITGEGALRAVTGQAKSVMLIVR